MTKLFNLVSMWTPTTGSETISLGSAVTGFLSFANAGAVEGDIVSYGIREGDNREVGAGVYSSASATLTRETIYNSTNSGSAITLAGSAYVYGNVSANDLAQEGWLPASESWTYASADAPTYTFNTSSSNISNTYTPGMRFKCDIDGGSRYFICTGATGSTVTVYGGTDYVMSASPITNSYYSTQKAPLGFPLDPTKWTVTLTDTTQRSQASPTTDTWYNLGSLSVTKPIGDFIMDTRCYAQGTMGIAVTTTSINVCLSTANNSSSDSEMQFKDIIGGVTSSTLLIYSTVYLHKKLTGAKTVYYINMLSGKNSMDTIYFRNDLIPLKISFTCAYL